MLHLTVKVISNASKNQIVGFEGDVLKVKIRAIREKGKANQALIDFLSETFKIPKSHIEIIQGKTSSLKRIRIQTTRENELLETVREPRSNQS